MNLFPLIACVQQEEPQARVERVSLWTTGVVSVVYRVAQRVCALHVWPDGQHVWRPEGATAACATRTAAAIAQHLAVNAVTLWSIGYMQHLQGVVLGDNMRYAKRELDDVRRPWVEADNKATQWPLAYAIAVVQAVSGARYGIKALHVLATGAVVTNIEGEQQVALTATGKVYQRRLHHKRTPWQVVELDRIAALLMSNWRKAARPVQEAWQKTFRKDSKQPIAQ